MDEQFKNVLKWAYHTEKGFDKYNGKELHEHSHEAGYDAHMTAAIFAYINKMKEIEENPELKPLLENGVA